MAKKTTIKPTTGIHLEVPNPEYYGISDDCGNIKIKTGKKPSIHERMVEVVVAGCKALKIKPREI